MRLVLILDAPNNLLFSFALAVFGVLDILLFGIQLVSILLRIYVTGGIFLQRARLVNLAD